MANIIDVWTIDPYTKIHSNSLPDDKSLQIELTAFKEGHANIQIALRTKNDELAVTAKVGSLIKILGQGSIEKNNLTLRVAEYTHDPDSLIPIEDSITLKPNNTQAIRLTIYIPEQTTPGAYHDKIAIQAGEEEILIPLLVKVQDITMPDHFNPKETARKYGADTIWSEQDWRMIDSIGPDTGICNKESSTNLELLTSGVENLKLLRLLEELETPDNTSNYEPWCKEICSGIKKSLEGKNTDTGALHKVHSDIIAAVQMAQIPQVDTGDTYIVSAAVAPATPLDFACGTEARFSFKFEIEWSPGTALQTGDYLRFTFRDLFCGELSFYKYPYEYPVEESLNRKIMVTLTSDNVKLTPSSYHVRVDIMRGDKSLSPIAPGGCQVYICREGESAKHMFACFTTSRTAYMWDEKQEIYYHMLPSRLPQSGDPFDQKARPVYEMELRREIARMRFDSWTGCHPMEIVVPEAEYDGGSGLLNSAKAFRRIGESGRAVFCENSVKRVIASALKYMVIEDNNGEKNAVSWGPLQQDAIVLKLLCEAYSYFLNEICDREYAKELFEQIDLIGKYQISQSLTLGCSESKVYDGRVLVGLSHYCLAEHINNGQFNHDHVETVIDFAQKISENTILYKGWHDNGGPEGHDGYGNMNVIWGLLAARRIALDTDRTDTAETFKKAILAAFNFLARTSACITGYTEWIPSRHGYWCAGDTYLMLMEMEHEFGQNKILTWYLKHLCDRDIAQFTKLTSAYGETCSFGSRNALTAFLINCEEYTAI